MNELYIVYILIGFSIIFIGNMLGSSLIFFFKKEINEKINTIFLGFASGIMVAASVFSLLVPSIEASEKLNYQNLSFIPPLIGFILGALFLLLIDKIIPHFHKGTNEEEGVKSNFNKSTKLFLAMTIHNIPEGLAVGFSFGGALLINNEATFISALMLSIGMAIQNFPEGAAVTLPLKETTKSKTKAFLLGSLSGVVEPIFALIGFFLATQISFLEPYMLSFAAGAMIYVVIEDLIPDAHMSSFPHLATFSSLIGFALMMVLDVALG